MFRLCKGVFNCPFLVLGVIQNGCKTQKSSAVISARLFRCWASQQSSPGQSTDDTRRCCSPCWELLMQASLWLRWLLMGHSSVVTGRGRGWNVWLSVGILNNISVWFCMPVWVYANDSFKIISLCAPLYCQSIWCINRFCGHKAKSYISFSLQEAEIIKSF